MSRKYGIRILLVISLSTIMCCTNLSESNSSIKQSPNLYQGPIIDMHIHAYDENAGGPMFGMNYTNPLTGDTYVAVENPLQQKTQTLDKFRKLNIVKALVSDGELWYDDAPDRIIISGRNAPVQILKERHSNGRLHAIGEVIAYYGGMSADDPLIAPYFDLAEELNIPIGYHIFPGGPPGGIYYLGMKDVRAKNANPLQIEEVLVRHPNTKIFIAHAGWPYLEDMKALMYAHPQLYVELGTINWILPTAEFHNFLEGLFDAGFGKRVMFGSDQMVFPETIDKAIQNINNATFLSLEQKADIFYNNAAKFLELSESEIAEHKARSE